MVNCCVLAPLEAAGTSGAVALFPPLENGGADVSVLVLVFVNFWGFYPCPPCTHVLQFCDGLYLFVVCDRRLILYRIRKCIDPM